MRKFSLVFPVVLVLAAGTVLACGGDGDPDPSARATPAPTTPSVQEFTVRGIEQGEQYLFDPATLNVSAGTIRVTFVNAGAERPHSFVVKTKAGDADLANSDRVELGQTKVVEFTVGEEGAYKIICTIRGHEDRGMIGTLNVGRPAAISQ